jgi:hypothetical protein
MRAWATASLTILAAAVWASPPSPAAVELTPVCAP